MKRFIVVAALAFALPVVAFPTCTWTANADGTSGNVVCTTVAETAIAGADSAALGWPLAYCPKGVAITACVDSTRTLSAAATLSVFVYDPQASLWAFNSDLNITTATISATQRCQNFLGIWTVVPAGRIALLPTAGTLSAGNFTIYFRCN
jgi:hypothetical protein